MLATQAAIRKITQRENLEPELVRKAALEIMEGRASSVLISGFLVGLHTKGETAEEIGAIAEAMMEKATLLDLQAGNLLDTCGTGGDHSGTFNISTAAAFVCAAAGIPVAKHGNRSQSSVSGSADVLEALGAKIDLTPDEALKVFEKIGITFIFAPLYHPALKHAAPVRKELGVRTIFNFIGPLVNPARASIRILGVAAEEYLERIASVLKMMGVKRALVYHSTNGLDEIALDAEVEVIEIRDNEIREYTLNHKDFGLQKVDHLLVKVDSPQESARAILAAFRGEKGPFYDYVVASAAAGIYIFGEMATLRGAVEKAKHTLDSGKAFEILEKFVEATGGKLVVS
jgi:anthranilate phosphoribosyltransferase